MEVVNLFIDPIAKLVPRIPGAILNFLIGYIIIRVVLSILRHTVKLLKIPHDLRGLIITVTKLVLWVMLVIFIANDLQFGNLAVILSGSAIVLVFFLNNSAGPLLANIFSGLSLIGDPDFTVGMHVIANDGKTKGVITGIDMRKVRFLDDDGKIHVVPNTAVENSEWIVVERKKRNKK